MVQGQELYDIGRITRPHGLRGEVRVQIITDFPERFQAMDSVIVQTPDGVRRRYNINGVRFHKGFVILQLEGVDTVEDAQRLRNSLLRVTRDELVPLPPGHYYISDLIGLEVYTEFGELLGTVSDVLQPGANDVYVVRPAAEGTEEILLPAIRDVVKDIDLESGRITVHLLPGLIEGS